MRMRMRKRMRKQKKGMVIINSINKYEVDEWCKKKFCFILFSMYIYFNKLMPTEEMIADMFTKPLKSKLFYKFRDALGLIEN